MPRSPRAATVAAALAVMALLGACSTPGTLTGAATALAPRVPAARFEAEGRVSARIAGDTSRGFSGGFTWAHDGSEDRIELLTPTGQTAARMSVTPGGAAIELADGRRKFVDSPEQFLSESLGVTLPIAALPYWMQAVPRPGERFRAEADLLGRPAALWQDGWEVRYTGYSDETSSAWPTRMQLSWGSVEARLIIADWKPRP